MLAQTKDIVAKNKDNNFMGLKVMGDLRKTIKGKTDDRNALVTN